MGLVDNLLRPLLIGKGTQMPDYLVLISTLGGIAAFGLSGFVIGPVVAALFIAVWDIFSRRGRGRMTKVKSKPVGSLGQNPLFPGFWPRYMSARKPR